MTGTLRRRPAPRTWLLAFTLALVFSLASAPLALAGEIVDLFGGQARAMTWNWYDSTFSTYYAYGYSYSGFAQDNIATDIRGYNNGGGWHSPNARAVCYIDAYSQYRACQTANIGYDGAGGSSQRYATTQHYFWWDGGSFERYTSTNPPGRSTFLCWARAGC